MIKGRGGGGLRHPGFGPGRCGAFGVGAVDGVGLALSLEPKTFMSADRLRVLEKATPRTPHAIWHLGMGTSPMTKWPQFGHDRNVFEAAFGERCADLGRCWGKVQITTNEAGKPIVSWDHNGVFTPLPAGQNVAEKKTSDIDAATQQTWKIASTLLRALSTP